MVSTLQPVERPLALGERVYHTLRDHLRNGQIVAGQPLQEVQLAEKLGVSRTPVREALRRLASEGLLVSDNRSFVVPSLTLQDVNDIYEIRFLIEPAAIRSIAPLTRSPELRRGIEDALAAIVRAHKAGDAAAFREATICFRAAWLALVPNPRLVRIVEQYADHMQRIRTLTLDDPEIRTIVLRGLNRISSALAAGDGDTAAMAMLDHLVEAKRAFIAAVGLNEDDPA
ncbi:GntR family transcriptional regulator [Azoarcus sp. CIB]|uniref:GntR family transcriptional regulator n=1 Tax=Aromatoleum sp. (strain CIB) TaxID=198107 RepID=UPI00067DDB57|nr:GntR family transcriptional regulator [Azoarcus sp. CIB]AKU11675.1 GntR family transcriptional regulator [Azoarcus sp. CIB]